MVHRIEIGRGADNVTWDVYIDASNFVTVNRTEVNSLLTGQQRQDNAIVSQCATDVLQMLWDAPTRQALADLSADDPDKTTDPGLPNLFHARVADEWGSGPSAVDVYRPTALVGGVATHLIGRGSLLSVVYTGSIETATILTESPPRSLR